jgi:hypothetical protein
MGEKQASIGVANSIKILYIRQAILQPHGNSNSEITNICL